MYRLFPETCDEGKAKEMSQSVEEVNLKLPKLHPHTFEFEHGGSKNAGKSKQESIVTDDNTSMNVNDMDSETNLRPALEKKTVADLKEMLREKNQKVSGKKSDLIDRLCGIKRKKDGNHSKGPTTKKQKTNNKRKEEPLEMDDDDYNDGNIYDSMDSGLGLSGLGGSDLGLSSHPKCSFCNREEMKCIDLPCFKRKLNTKIHKTRHGTCTACQQKMDVDDLDKHFRADLSEDSLLLDDNSNPNPNAPNPSQHPSTVLLIRVSALCYWTFLSVPARSTLKDLDDWLRTIWMECCGHLSSIRVLPISDNNNNNNNNNLNNSGSGLGGLGLGLGLGNSGMGLNGSSNNVLGLSLGGIGLSPMMSFPSPFNMPLSPLNLGNSVMSLSTSQNSVSNSNNNNNNNNNNTITSAATDNNNNNNNNNTNLNLNSDNTTIEGTGGIEAGGTGGLGIGEEAVYWSTTMRRGGSSGGWARKMDMKDVEMGTFGEGTQMEYCYHMGSATPSYLRISVLRIKTDKVSHFCPKKEEDAGDQSGQIEVLAVNTGPEVPCAEYGCKGQAVYVCTVCDKWKDFLCNEHGKAHGHRSCISLVFNSPRVGICRYKSCGL
eukprot:TRINITY_DN4534_c0_g4_i1.p1 TRINITY_DN4534_c0_g4~~TRINITY_DN4534_c0_g4_i1.p1  ORF type:complete len:600 (-),score=176.24 TRINITY_DN4534_c0_g4_i1:7-1806(-)